MHVRVGVGVRVTGDVRRTVHSTEQAARARALSHRPCVCSGGSSEAEMRATITNRRVCSVSDGPERD